MVIAKRWYVLHVFSGSEKKVAQSIREQAATHGLEDQVEDVMVPTENVVEVKRGVRVEGERKFFPGYILVKLELSYEAWQMVTSQPRVTGFLGGKGRPIPITDKEAERLIRQVAKGLSVRAQQLPLTLASRYVWLMGHLRHSMAMSKKPMMIRRG